MPEPRGEHVVEERQQDEVAEQHQPHEERQQHDVERQPQQQGHLSYGIGFRHAFAAIGSFGFVIVYALRVCLSVTVVIMANEFDWDEKRQGIVLSSFFFGYLALQIPGGNLAERRGGRFVFGLGVLFTCVFTLLTPIAAKLDFYALIVVRIMTGLGEGVTFPAMHAMLSHWAPKDERSRLGCVVYTGATLGTVSALPLTAVIANAWGWEVVFYAFGGVGLAWCVLWFVFVDDAPETSRWMSRGEKDYLRATNSTLSHSPAVPYQKIFTCKAFYAILVAHMANNYGFYTLLTELPTYMDKILHFSLTKNGTLSALPYLLSFFVSLIGGWTADGLITRDCLSTTVVRKLFTTLGLSIPAVALTILAFSSAKPDPTVAVALLCVAVGSNGCQMVGVGVNHIDVAANFAGSLMGFTNTAANAMGIVAPYVVGQIINDHEDVGHWRVVFLIAAAIYVIGNVVFVAFGSGKEQEFNRVVDRDEDREGLIADDELLDDTNVPQIA